MGSLPSWKEGDGPDFLPKTAFVVILTDSRGRSGLEVDASGVKTATIDHLRVTVQCVRVSPALIIKRLCDVESRDSQFRAGVVAQGDPRSRQAGSSCVCTEL